MIFGIGLSKTGTSSLAEALRHLGFEVRHYHLDSVRWSGPANLGYVLVFLNLINRLSGKETLPLRTSLYLKWENSLNLDSMTHYDAVCDLPVNLYYKELDKHFPNSKFILTVRDTTSWLKSAENHFKSGWRSLKQHNRNRVRLDTYGSIEFDSEKYLSAYLKYLEEVRKYFKGRDNFLELDITSGEGYEKLCPFLGLEYVNSTFPMLNNKLQK